MRFISFTALGEPASKANSRQFVKIKGTPRLIKSAKARSYVESFRLQCPRQSPPLSGDLCVEIKIWYASRRPDLDESVILDAMQGLVYENDRQVKRKIVDWGLDPANPRAEILVSEMAPSVQSAQKKQRRAKGGTRGAVSSLTRELRRSGTAPGRRRV